MAVVQLPAVLERSGATFQILFQQANDVQCRAQSVLRWMNAPAGPIRCRQQYSDLSSPSELLGLRLVRVLPDSRYGYPARMQFRCRHAWEREIQYREYRDRVEC